MARSQLFGQTQNTFCCLARYESKLTYMNNYSTHKHTHTRVATSPPHLGGKLTKTDRQAATVAVAPADKSVFLSRGNLISRGVVLSQDKDNISGRTYATTTARSLRFCGRVLDQRQMMIIIR